MRPRSIVSILAFAAIAAAGMVRAQPIAPEPLPDPKIPGFRFPESEATLTQWITEMSRAAGIEAKNAAAAKIYLHGWGLWTALTADSPQSYEGQRLRVFETWLTPDDLANPPVVAEIQSAVRTIASSDRDRGEDVLNRAPPRRSSLQPLDQLVRGELRDDSSPTNAAAQRAIDRVVGFVKFDPAAADHIVRQDLFKLSTLEILLGGGAQQIPSFPSDALVVKPVFQVIRARDLVEGRYYLIKAWPGPPEVAQPWGPAQWPGAVWIDLLGGGSGGGAIDAQPVADGSTRTEATTYPIATLIHYRLSAADAAALNAAKPGTGADEGDTAILVAMHVSTRELARWTWQTFWWTPSPDDPLAPSSPTIAAVRPAQLRGAPAHYAMALAYTMLSPDQPYVGGENNRPAVYAYNPWIEARFAPADLPDSRPGYDPAGRPSANNTGVQTNCMSCHIQATYNPRLLPTAPRFSGARYIDVGAAEFVGTLQVDFLWSLPRHAK